MRGTAIFFFVVAAVLIVVFNRAAFFGDGPGSFIRLDFSAIFYGAQWAGFWCAVLSVVLFAVSASRSHTPLMSTRHILPGLDLVLCIYFFAFSMPEWSNFDEWRHGALGANVYIQTKVARWREQRADAELKGAFLGNWKAQDGARLAIDLEKVILTSGGVATEFSNSTCPTAPYIRYTLASRDDIGYHFYRSGLLSSDLFKRLPDRKYPLLAYTCNGRDLAFMALQPRELFAVLYDGTAMIFTRI